MLRVLDGQGRGFPRILVVDDDGGLQLLVRGILEQYGYMVDVAADGLAACEMAGQTNYDAIVCDVIMPRMDGTEFYAKLRETDSEQAQRVVFVTGAILDGPTREQLHHSGRRVIRKPFNIEEFELAIAEVVGD